MAQSLKTAPSKACYLEDAVALSADNVSASVAALRTWGLEQFSEVEMPHSKMEAWRHANLASLAVPEFRCPDYAGVEAEAVAPLLYADAA